MYINKIRGHKEVGRLPIGAGGGKAGPYSSASQETAASLASLETSASRVGVDNLSSTSPGGLPSGCSSCDGLGGDWSSTSKMDPPPQRLGFFCLDCDDGVG